MASIPMSKSPWRRCAAAFLVIASFALVLTSESARAGTLATMAKDARTHRCLALALYWEARAEGRDGMIAVAAVILNRMRHPAFPDTMCEVIKEGGEEPPCQFSWWCDGKSDMPTEPRAWRHASRVAQDFLHRPPPDPTGGALFFHHTALLPPWKRERVRTAIIGRHAYYR